MDAHAILEDLWASAGCQKEALDTVTLSGGDPVLPSCYRVGSAAQVSIAALALAAAKVGEGRGLPQQTVKVEMRHAAAEFRSERYLRVAGALPPDPWDKIAGKYRCGDGRWLRIHTNFPHHRDGILNLLACDYSREAVAAALQNWDAEAAEQAAADADLIAAMMRAPEAWAAHPQGRALAPLPLISIEKIGEADPLPLAPAPRPLSGIRVLDLTRIIAGPVGGRALAAHGADVLRVTAAHLPFIPATVIDAGRGKLSTAIDLRDPAGRETLQGLLRDSDVFLQGYRPGALAGRGFSPAAAAALRPGIVYVSLSAYGQSGPWAARRGFDSIVQTASGINHQEAAARDLDEPKELPCQALDHAAGYFLAFGALAALQRQRREGGSWHVQVSLARTGQWLQSLGQIPDGIDCADPTFEDVTEFLEETDSGFGRLTAVRHAGQLSHSPPAWSRPAMPLGSHPAAWPVLV